MTTHTHWTEFLTSQSAYWLNDRISHFADNTNNVHNENTHILCDLSHYGLISISGDDAQHFLQNQFCNDVLKISPQQSQLNAYCTPKGRILAFFRLFQQDGYYYLRLPQEILKPILKRLRMYVMMSKVTLDNVSEQRLRIGFSGPQARQRLSKYIANVPTQTDAVSHSGDVSIICLQANTRYEIIADNDSMQILWEKLSSDAQALGASAWELADIQAGIPEVFSDTQEAFVPQMLNLQAVNALSFKKGCYPGQEIVARMHYLGKLKRRMFAACISGHSAVKAGDTLYAEGSESAQGVGKVVRAQNTPAGSCDLLAVIEISSAEQRSLRLHDVNGPQLHLKELPYPLSDE
jgi:tRNA-modifying protein YgfZ